MRVISLTAIFVTTITVFVFVNAFPTDSNDGRNTLSDVYQKISPDEAPDSVLPGETSTRRRVKRSGIIGFIRQICPPLANFLNSLFNTVKTIAFKIIGRLLFSGNKKTTAGQEKPVVSVNLGEMPYEEETTTEAISSTDSSPSPSSDNSSPSTEDNPSTETPDLPSSDSSSSPSDTSSSTETTSAVPETTPSSTESNSAVEMNSISTKTKTSAFPATYLPVG